MQCLFVLLCGSVWIDCIVCDTIIYSDVEMHYCRYTNPVTDLVEERWLGNNMVKPIT